MRGFQCGGGPSEVRGIALRIYVYGTFPGGDTLSYEDVTCSHDPIANRSAM